MTWPRGKGRAIGIVRVSTLKQKDNNSPAIQRADIEGYAARSGLTLTGIAEVHESAKIAKRRRRFREVLDKARADGIQHLVYWRFDRSTRNFTDLESMQEDIRDGTFAAVHFVNDGSVLHAKSPSGDWLRAKVEALVANEYSAAVSERALSSTIKHAADGHFPGLAPIGYVNKQVVDDQGRATGRNGYLQLTDEGRRLLRRMRELRLQEETNESIAETVLAEGLVPERSRTGFKGARGAGRVQAILTNPFYVGVVRWRGEEYQGKHEPIFTRQEWDELQATFGKRGPYRKRKHDGTFSGFLRCSICGCAVVYDPKTKKTKAKQDGVTYLYYACSNMTRAHEHRPRVTEAELMVQFQRVVEEINLSEPRAKQIAAALNDIEKQAQAAHVREAASFQRDLEQLEGREDSLYDDLKAGILDDDAYKRQLERVREDRRRIADMLTRAQAGITDSCLITARQLIELATRAKTLWESQTPRERRALLDDVISNPVLDGRSVRYDLKKPYRLISEMGKSEEWRARMDSNHLPPA
jgi:site-specific DNA recombinase